MKKIGNRKLLYIIIYKMMIKQQRENGGKKKLRFQPRWKTGVDLIVRRRELRERGSERERRFSGGSFGGKVRKKIEKMG